MKNCLEFTIIKLTNFIVTFGVFDVIDALRKFGVLIDVVTLNKEFHETDVLEEMKFGAILTEVGYSIAYNLKAQSDLIKHLIKIICNPGSEGSEVVVKINSALKCLCLKVNGNTDRFYSLMSDAMYKRMMFQKISQIFLPLIEEVKVNKEFLNCMINSKLIDLNHLNQLTGNEQSMKIAHYIVNNVNDIRRLKQFLYIVKNWVRDRNLIEDLEETAYEIVIYQCGRIENKIKEDIEKKLCLLY